MDDEAFGGVCVMVNMNQLGEAAGTAAFIALTELNGFPGVDIKKLRCTLSSGGSIII